jgi:PAS domain S-box-containing protein
VLRTVANGAAFAAMIVALMIARIHVGDDAFIDARHVPLALIALFEGWPTALIAAAPPILYRLSLGGAGAWPGAIGLLATALLGAGAHAWARRRGGVGPRHALVLSVAVFVVNSATFPLASAHAIGLLERFWPQMLLTCVLGIGLIAKLFADVIEQARLTTEQQRFRAVLDEASDAIRILDPETLTILDCNRRDCEISGWPRDELIGRNAREFWPEDAGRRSRREATVAEARAHGTARAFGQPYRRRSGEVITVDATRRIVEYAGRRYEIVIFRESADREARESSQREAAELKAVTLLAAAASHEINNPLAVVMGSLGLLSRGAPPDTQEGRWIAQALEGVHRIRDIVVRMRTITRVETTPVGRDLPPILDITKSAPVPQKEPS